MTQEKLDPEALQRELRAVPLLEGVLDESLAAIDFEIGLLCGARSLPPDCAERPSYLRVVTVEPGASLGNQGDQGADVGLVLKGFVSSYWSSGKGAAEIIATLKPGSWFGEASVLSNVPSLTTLRADTDAQVVLIDARFFFKLYSEDEVLRERIDTAYTERSLPLHLRIAPLLSGLDREELDEIVRGSRLVTFADPAGGETVAAQGDAAETFFLVVAGGVKCVVKEPSGKTRLQAYYMANSSFGEHAVATTGAVWPATYETVLRTSLVEIPQAAFARLKSRRPEAHRTLTHAANLILAGDLEGASRVNKSRQVSDELNVMVFRQSLKGGDALIIDKSKCIRCNACVEACVSVHDDRVPRISKIGTQISSNKILISSCYHCDVPDCMAACGYGAIRRDPQGEVLFIHDNCVGCSACVMACPYDVIRMTNPAQNEAARKSTVWQRSLAAVRGLFSLGARKKTSPSIEPGQPASFGKVMNYGPKEVEVTGKALKCDYCAGLPFEACVYNCPTFAISRRSPEELFRA